VFIFRDSTDNPVSVPLSGAWHDMLPCLRSFEKIKAASPIPVFRAKPSSFVTYLPPLWPPDEVPLDAVLLDEVPLDAVLLDEVVLDEAAGPPPAGAGCGLYSASYAVGLTSLVLAGFSLLVPYIAVLLLLAVLGRLEHPTMPNKDAVAVIQSKR
jgi:hypothetical protein